MLLVDVINGLYSSGKAKLYFPAEIGRRNANQRVIEFGIDNEGNLTAELKLELYDYPYWNGVKFDKYACLEEDLSQTIYNSDSIDLPVSSLLCCNLLQQPKDSKKYVVVQNYSYSYMADEKNSNKMLALNQLYSMVDRMLSGFANLDVPDTFDSADNLFFRAVRSVQRLDQRKTRAGLQNILLQGERDSNLETDEMLGYREIIDRLSASILEFRKKYAKAKMVVFGNSKKPLDYDEELNLQYVDDERLNPYTLNPEDNPHLTNQQRREKQLSESIGYGGVKQIILSGSDSMAIQLQAVRELSRWMDERAINSYQASQWIHINIGDNSIYINEEGYNSFISGLEFDTTQISPELAEQISVLLYYEMARQMEINPSPRSEHFTYNDYRRTHQR